MAISPKQGTLFGSSSSQRLSFNREFEVKVLGLGTWGVKALLRVTGRACTCDHSLRCIRLCVPLCVCVNCGFGTRPNT